MVPRKNGSDGDGVVVLSIESFWFGDVESGSVLQSHSSTSEALLSSNEYKGKLANNNEDSVSVVTAVVVHGAKRIDVVMGQIARVASTTSSSTSSNSSSSSSSSSNSRSRSSDPL
ncbi:hypothetical protein HZH66_007111 [Vespula vulgaris]|uniref:Uncharacterized protein n=1 Tax=Vespula vulgaris TaxID=7454 RepID=A0A834JWY7_VESVU|nr:hypothetical protein HZH66_007111 [Vespula vulgaris]